MKMNSGEPWSGPPEKGTNVKIVIVCTIVLFLFSCTTVDSSIDIIEIPEIENSAVNDNDAVIPDTALADEIDPKKSPTEDQKEYAGKKPARDDESFEDFDISTYIQNDYIHRLQAPDNEPSVPTEAPLIVLAPMQEEDVADTDEPDEDTVLSESKNTASVSVPSVEPVSPPVAHVNTPVVQADPPALSDVRPEPPTENTAVSAKPAEAIRINETREAGYNPDTKKVQIELDGLGWYLVEPPSEGLRFQDLYPGTGKTLLVFLVSEDGRYILQLARQNIETGEEEKRAIQLVVTPEVKSIPELTETPETALPVANVSNNSGGKETAPAQDEDVPLSLLNEPARLTPEIGDDELKRLLMNAVALKRPLAAIEILSNLDHNQDLDADVLFLLGQYYDIHGPGKDMEKAYLYYGRLVNDFPLHDKWNEAVRRYRYLKNRFFG